MANPAAAIAAEVIVVGAPMYNFSVPTQLIAWPDRMHHQESWLAARFGFIGISGEALNIVRAEGLPVAAEVREPALRTAAQQIASLVPPQSSRIAGAAA